MNERRLLYRSGWGLVLAGIYLYLFVGAAFVSGVLCGAGALLAFGNAETYSQRKAGVLVWLRKFGLPRPANEKDEDVA